MTWKVLSKRLDKSDDGHYLILVVERAGVHREAVVSGATWLAKEPGDEVELSEK